MTTNTPTAADVQRAIESALEMLRGVDINKTDVAHLVPLALSLKAAGDYTALVHGEIELRAIAVPGAAVKDKRSNRVWHDQLAAEALAQETFGDDAFTRTLKSPSQMEKLGPQGKMFAAMAAHQPDAGKTVVY